MKLSLVLFRITALLLRLLTFPMWKLNYSVLAEVEYVALSTSVWASWSPRKHSFASLIDWWESAKSKIKGLTVTYCKNRAARLLSGRDPSTYLASHLKSQVDSGHMFCLGPYHSTLDELRKLDEAEVEGARVLALVRWAKEPLLLRKAIVWTLAIGDPLHLLM